LKQSAQIIHWNKAGKRRWNALLS